MTRIIQCAFFSLLLIIAFGCAVHQTSVPTTELVPQKDELMLEKFNLLWKIIVDQHFSALPDTPEERFKCFQNMLIAGVSRCLNDPYSRYLSKEDVMDRDTELDGAYTGVGLVVEFDDKERRVVIAEIIPDSPAERSDMFKVGDGVIEVDGKDVRGQSLTSIVQEVRGLAGTSVTMVIERNRKKREPIILVRAEIMDSPSVFVQDMGDDITYVDIRNFHRTATDAFYNALASRVQHSTENGSIVIDPKARKFIFDVRENPGGIIGVVAMMSYFFSDDPDQIIVTIQSRHGDRIIRIRDLDGDNPIRPGVFKGVEAVVIIDNGTASAAEIFADFLYEVMGFLRIGDPSRGKGTVQMEFLLEGDDALLLTIGEYIIGNKKTAVNQRGITPEYNVSAAGFVRKPNHIDPDNDPQLKKAVQLLRTQEKIKK